MSHLTLMLSEALRGVIFYLSLVSRKLALRGGGDWNFNLDILPPSLILFFYTVLPPFKTTVFGDGIMQRFFTFVFKETSGESGYFLGFQNKLPCCKVFCGRAVLLRGRSDLLAWGSIHWTESRFPWSALTEAMGCRVVFRSLLLLHNNLHCATAESASSLHYLVISFNSEAELETLGPLLIFLLLNIKRKLKFSYYSRERNVSVWFEA